MGDLRKLLKNGGKDWKCNLCEKYLSVVPIYCYPSQKYVCGRCVQKNLVNISNEQLFERQWLFENLASLVSFPCSYDIFGCKAELEIKEIIAHEDFCPFRNTLCPLNEMNRSFLLLEEICNWRGDNRNLVPHIKLMHQNYFLKQLEFNLSSNQTFFYFTEELNQVFMVIFKYLKDEQKYIVPVYTNLSEIECNFFRYQLEIWLFADSSMVFRRNRVEPLHDQVFQNSVGCDLKIDTVYLKELLDSNHFRAKLSITRKNKRQLKTLPGSNLQVGSAVTVTSIEDSKKQLTSTAKILQRIECIVCNEYMISPIFLCKFGHSICNRCTELVQCCPACRSEMTRTRNYQLEQLAETLDYPCRYKSLGCSFIASFKNYKMHESNCQYSSKPCILQCSWSGDNIQMIIHLQQSHELFNIDDILTLRMTSQRKKLTKAVVHNNHIFLFTILWSTCLPLVFSVCNLSYDFKHKYRIHLMDRSDNKLDIIVNYLCPMLVLSSDKKYLKDDSRNESKLPFDMIKHLVDGNGEIVLKLTIFQVKG